MRRDRKRKDTEENRKYILNTMYRRLEHSLYKDRPRMRIFTLEQNDKALPWDDFLDRYLINILWSEADKKDKIYRGAILVFKTEDNRIYLADTNKKILALNGEGCDIDLPDDVVWDLNYYCVFKFGDVVGNKYCDGSGTL